MEEAELKAETRSRNPEKRSAEEEDVAYEKETEQDILARARALATSQAQAQAQQSVPRGVETVDEPEPSFPSLPTHIPMDESQDPIDNEAEARMALLLGLSGPSTKPGPPRLPSPPKERKLGQGWNLPGYKDDRDEDPDSWCCMLFLQARGGNADNQVFVIKMPMLFVSDVTMIRIARNAGLRDMWGRDIVRNDMLARGAGRL